MARKERSLIWVWVGSVRRLEGWESDDELEAKAKAKPQKAPILVVFKHMFTFKELDDDPTLLFDLKEDVRQECESFGTVTNVILYYVGPYPPPSWRKTVMLNQDAMVAIRKKQTV